MEFDFVLPQWLPQIDMVGQNRRCFQFQPPIVEEAKDISAFSKCIDGLVRLAH
jgi:hypothetical protein